MSFSTMVMGWFILLFCQFSSIKLYFVLFWKRTYFNSIQIYSIQFNLILFHHISKNICLKTLSILNYIKSKCFILPWISVILFSLFDYTFLLNSIHCNSNQYESIQFNSIQFNSIHFIIFKKKNMLKIIVNFELFQV